jgi:hypothetical protein
MKVMEVQGMILPSGLVSVRLNALVCMDTTWCCVIAGGISRGTYKALRSRTPYPDAGIPVACGNVLAVQGEFGRVNVEFATVCVIMM